MHIMLPRSCSPSLIFIAVGISAFSATTCHLTYDGAGNHINLASNSVTKTVREPVMLREAAAVCHPPVSTLSLTTIRTPANHNSMVDNGEIKSSIEPYKMFRKNLSYMRR